MITKAYLILEDGTVLEGKSFGAKREVVSEIVFNTSMTGYLEVLTDPSYAGQAVTMTYPLIGNYGIAKEDMESGRGWPDGFIVREFARMPSNFRSEDSIEHFLQENDIPGIYGIDTRALTKILREKGTMNGMITTDEHYDLDQILPKLREYRVSGVVKKVSGGFTASADGKLNRSGHVTSAEGSTSTDCQDTSDGCSAIVGVYRPGDLGSQSVEVKYQVAVIDVGTKKNIIRCLLNRGCEVTVYSCDFDAQEVIDSKPDGIMITNGPGDPSECVDIIAQIRELADAGIPIFAICLGHQLMALAHDAKTYKMKYGHRGVNHPVKNLDTGKVYISSQNHGYVVDADSLDPAVARPWFINVNDQTIEGLWYLEKPIRTVQFHPEANAGPKDSELLFEEFIKML
ncbi:MAG: carbamoyl phosphate synthase small subunit [Lachnospiraceae bacterium]|nr:carbamoyl phosphate synthase small subunit [Lachnospiraceae bacterium]